MRYLSLMKSFVIIILNVFIGFVLNAQNNALILNAPESGNQTHVACKEIRMQDGYHYAAAPGQFMHAYIDPSMICDVDYMTNGFSSGNPPALNTSLEVGTTPGSFAVSPSGGATYNVPLMTPPGTMGVVPNLSVSYNSQSGDGLLGIGWTLSGLSAITRVQQSKYYDGTTSPVTLTTTGWGADRFALDGQRLIVTGTDMGNTVYGTEAETFTKITSFNSAGSGPEYFEVRTKDGSYLEYGKTSDSRIEASGIQPGGTVLTWLLNKVHDMQGNAMNIHYEELNNTGEFRPDYIEYCGTNNRINFFYGTRSDKQVAYVAGHQVQQNVLLTRMEMSVQGIKVHEYDFNYSFDNYFGSRLSEVIEKGTDDKQYNSTKIAWGNDLGSIDEYTISNNNSLDDGFAFVGDFNGDGFSDFCKTGWNGSNLVWQLSLNNGSGNFNYTNAGGLPPGFVAAYSRQFDRIVDLNGDGKDDILVLCVDPAHDDFYVPFYSTGTGFTAGLGDIFKPGEHAFSNGSRHIITGDFDADGATDLFVYYDNAGSGWWYLKSFKTGNLISSGGNAGWAPDQSISFNTVDINGDGRDEVMFTLSPLSTFRYVSELINGNLTTINVSGFPASYQEVFPGDFNGDGKTDILAYSDPSTGGGGWTIGYSMGSTFSNDVLTPAPLADHGKPSAIHYLYFVSDFNGDGKSDIAVVNHDTKNSWNEYDLTVYYSLGNNKFSSETINSIGWATSLFPGLTGDFNGDGRSEILHLGDDGSSIYRSLFLSKYPGSFGFYSNNVNKVTSITNGLNTTVSVSYNTLPELANAPSEIKYSQYPSCLTCTNGLFPIFNMQKPLAVVDRTMADDGIGGKNTVDYSFAGAQLHLQGKGFLGFTVATTTNYSNNIQATNYNTIYGSSNNFQNLLQRQTTSSISPSQPIADKTYQYTFESGSQLFHPANLRYYTYVSSLSDVDHLHGNSTFYNFHQTYGNTDNEYSSNSAETTTKTYSYEQQQFDWIPCRLTNCTTTVSRPGNPYYTRFYNITNNSYGQTHTKIDDTGLQSIFDYDVTTGVLKKSSLIGNTIAGSVTEYEYDPLNRFITKQTNILGHVTEMAYDDAYGNLLSIKDPNLLVTQHSYDGFGRLKQTTTPTNKQITINRFSNDGTGPNHTSYFLKTSEDETPTTTEYFDEFGKTLRSQVTGFDGNDIKTDKTYNNIGLLLNESEPYKGFTPSNNTFYTYDQLNRIQNITTATNSSTTYNYTPNTNITQIVTQQGSVTKSVTKTLDASGLLISSVENGDANTSLTYTYHSCGKPLSITIPGGSTTTMTYDNFGRQITLNDPDAGKTTYGYDELGELTYQQNAKQFLAGTHETMLYDRLRRIDLKYTPDGIIEYLYDNALGKGKGSLWQVNALTGYSGISYEYSYDNFSRLQSKKEKNIDGNNYTTGYLYDNLNRVINLTYPGGFSINRSYNNIGYLEKIQNATDNSLIWQCNSMTDRGQVETATSGKIGNQQYFLFNQYDNLGYLKNTQVKISGGQNIWDQHYDFDLPTSNLSSRNDNLSPYSSEAFTYDNMDRLTTISLNGNSPLTTNYYPSGNIGSKDGVGIYDYNSAQPHAVSAIEAPSPNIPTIQQDITYTAYNKVEKITEGPYEADFFYGPDYDRKKMVIKQNTQIAGTKYYFGNYEKTIAGDYTRELHYIAGSDGLCAIFAKNKNTSTGIEKDTMYYIHTDHLGSIALINDEYEVGPHPQVISYDAWGHRRDGGTWSDPTIPVHYIFDRGFTGHEHLDMFGLVNMNGRMYDPLVGRMLSPDNYIQARDFTQAYNRYNYAYNNPLRYTDPDGEWVELVIGGVIGGVEGYELGQAMGAHGWGLVGYTLGGAAIGAISGGLASGVASSGIAGANTLAIVTGSLASSSGFYMLSGGRTQLSVGFGLGSYNFDTGKFGYVGKKGNSTLENLGYGLGTWGNLSDAYAIVQGAYGENVKENFSLVTKNDPTGHAAIVDENGTNIVSVGPKEPIAGDKIDFISKDVPGQNDWSNHLKDKGIDKLTVTKIRLTNLNTDNVREFADSHFQSFEYTVFGSSGYSCVTGASKALLNAGVLNIPFYHPIFLELQVALSRNSYMSYYLWNNYGH